MSLNDPRRILVIDDNDAIHSDFRKILCGSASTGATKLAGAKALLFGKAATPEKPKSSSQEFEVESALQGEQGFAKLQAAMAANKPFQVAFVDMRMPPGWDGLQTIQRLWEVAPDLQVVICSAYSDYSWEEISEKLGLTDRLLILKKPFDPAEVIQLATALCEKWHLRQAAKLKLDELERMVADRTRDLEAMALRDKLTGLGNRMHFNDRLATAVEKAATTETYKFAVLFLDFDRFKVVNDSLGHEAGDKVLQGIAQRLSAALQLAGSRVGDAVACRLGGDEFTILVDNSGGGTFDPAEFAAQLLNILAAPYRVAERDCYCTASIGITSSDVRYKRADEALRDADTAMYHAKANGKARYVVFDRPMHEAARQRLEMEHDLRSAIDGNELLLHYQPIIHLETGELHGFEALVRWQRPNRGLVPPMDFIPCCEDIGLIPAVGLWTLREACQQLKQWRERAPHLPHLTVAVNLSPAQLNDPGLIGAIEQILRDAQIPPQSLVLEITESAMMSDPQAAIHILRALRDLGVKLHLDDFGTGYSSLSSLHQFPLNGVKIDRSFMRNVTERRDYAAVVHAINNLARHLNMQVVVEGIESGDHIALLQAMDCDFAQGFHFGKPVDADTATKLYLQPTATGFRAQAA